MRLHRTTVLRSCAAVLVAGGALAAVAGPSSAAGPLDPLGTVTKPLTDALPTLPVPQPTARSVPSVPLPPVPLVPLPTGGGSQTASPQPTSTRTSTTTSGSQVNAQPAAATSRSGSSAQPRARTAAPAPRPEPRPAASAAADTPAGSLCLFASSGATPAFEVAGRALGTDLASPLVERFPQAFAPCPAGAVPAGDHVAAVDAAVTGLVGACVRVTRQVAPLQTTLVVLDHDLVRELAAAGLPLQQLVVPCPSRSAGSSPGTQVVTTHGPTSHQSSLSSADQVSALSAIGRLAFTGGDVLPTVLSGLGLLSLGVLFVRASRLVPARVTARRR